MKNSDIIHYIKKIEKNNKKIVEKKIYNTNIWPLIRFRLINRIQKVINNRTMGTKFFPIQLLKYNIKYINSFSMHLTTTYKGSQSADIVFFSHPVSWVNHEGRSNYDRHMDPLKRIAEECGYECGIVRLKKAPKVSYKIRSLSILILACVENFYDFLLYLRLSTQIFIETKALIPFHVLLYQELKMYYIVFNRLLINKNPNLIVTSYYSNIECLGLIAASSGRNIPTADFQHGVISNSHPAYAGWRCNSPENCELLPSFFLTWSKREAKVIGEWSSKSKDHKPIVVGNPWWKVSVDTFGDELTHLLKSSSRTRCRVLIALQNSVPPSCVIEAMRRGGGRFEWWIREHPRYPGVIDRLSTNMHLSGLTIDFVAANKYPLPAILTGVDVILTGYSSVITEGAYMGVRAVSWSQEVFGFYNELIADEVLRVQTNDPEKILRDLLEQGSEKKGTIVDSHEKLREFFVEHL
jgi:hypothetical protein